MNNKQKRKEKFLLIFSYFSAKSFLFNFIGNSSLRKKSWMKPLKIVFFFQSQMNFCEPKSLEKKIIFLLTNITQSRYLLESRRKIKTSGFSRHWEKIFGKFKGLKTFWRIVCQLTNYEGEISIDPNSNKTTEAFIVRFSWFSKIRNIKTPTKKLF